MPKYNKVLYAPAEGGKQSKPQPENAMSDVIREALTRARDAGVSPHHMAAACGINKDSLYRFIKGKTSLNSNCLDALCATFGFDLLAPSPDAIGERVLKSEGFKALGLSRRNALSCHK